MTPNNLCKLLPILLLPVGACMGDDTDIDTAEPTALFDDVHPGPGTQVALSPDLAVLPGASVDAPIEPPVPDGNPAPAGDADMAWNGSQWLAVWTDLRGGDADIRAAVVSADGEVDPPAGVLLIGGAGDQHDPKVAWNGGRYLVVYDQTRDGITQVRAARVTADAVVLDPDGFAAGAQMLASDIHIACNGTSFYAVWQGDCAMEACPGTIRGQYISSAGAAGPVATLAYKAALPQIAWNGNDYLVVWNDLGGVDVDISARIVHADATPGATTSISARAGDQELPVVAASGDRFLVAWREQGALLATVFDPLGNMKPQLVSRAQLVGRPAIAGNDGAWALAWTAVSGDEVQVAGVALGHDLRAISSWISVRLPAAGDADLDDKHPTVSFAGNGDHALVGWQDYAASGATTVWARPTTAQAPFLVSALP